MDADPRSVPVTVGNNSAMEAGIAVRAIHFWPMIRLECPMERHDSQQQPHIYPFLESLIEQQERRRNPRIWDSPYDDYSDGSEARSSEERGDLWRLGSESDYPSTSSGSAGAGGQPIRTLADPPLP